MRTPRPFLGCTFCAPNGRSACERPSRSCMRAHEDRSYKIISKAITGEDSASHSLPPPPPPGHLFNQIKPEECFKSLSEWQKSSASHSKVHTIPCRIASAEGRCDRTTSSIISDQNAVQVSAACARHRNSLVASESRKIQLHPNTRSENLIISSAVPKTERIFSFDMHLSGQTRASLHPVQPSLR